MFATFIIQIFSRYVLNNPIGWSEEVVITMWLWTVLWGAAFILSEKEEIRFDIINLLDQIYQIRNGSGVGVGNPQFGPRRTFLAGLTQRF